MIWGARGMPALVTKQLLGNVSDPWAELQVDPTLGPGALPAGLVKPCPKPWALIHKPIHYNKRQICYYNRLTMVWIDWWRSAKFLSYLALLFFSSKNSNPPGALCSATSVSFFQHLSRVLLHFSANPPSLNFWSDPILAYFFARASPLLHSISHQDLKWNSPNIPIHVYQK